jgi:hypothetical protein
MFPRSHVIRRFSFEIIPVVSSQRRLGQETQPLMVQLICIAKPVTPPRMARELNDALAI